MPNYDCPDYQHIILIVTNPAVSDCPDWQEQVTGPSGGVVPGTTSFIIDYPPDFAPGPTLLLTWTGDAICMPYTTVQLANGTIYGAYFKCIQSGPCAGAQFYITGAGASFTSGENYVSLWSSSGTGLSAQIAKTASGTVEANFNSLGPQTVNWATPTTVVAGAYYWLFVLINATTRPTLGFLQYSAPVALLQEYNGWISVKTNCTDITLANLQAGLNVTQSFPFAYLNNF